MKAFRMTLIVAFLLGTNTGFAANQVVSYFGNNSNVCARGASKELLAEYTKSITELRELKAKNGNPERIAQLEVAIEIVVAGLNIKEYGMTVVALTNRDLSLSFNIPTVTIMDETFPLAEVSISSASQVKIEFKKLGICGFANPNNGFVGDTEIQNAVDYILSDPT